MCASAGCRHNNGSHKNEKIPPPGNSVYAHKFTLTVNDTCSILSIINPWQGADDVRQVFYLVRQDQKALRNVDPAEVIQIPVKSIICTSTTHIAMVSALGQEAAIKGVSGARYVFNKTLLQEIKEGKLPDIGYDNGINAELIMRIKPDLMIMYGVGGEGEGISGKIREMGIKVIYDADYLEKDPLGKAEWIKFFGALFGISEKADSVFNSVAASYNYIKDYVAGHSYQKPKVLLGLPFRDTWFVSPGNSYVSKLIGDAGGDYLWKDKESEISMPFSLENVFIKAGTTDFWLNIGSVSGKSEITAFDPRLCEIPAFRYGRLFNNNARMSENGGNDYWESGTVYPDILLKDIASILHPELFKDYKMVYYKQVE
jgi:iron complex transport system substrate-binding protein